MSNNVSIIILICCETLSEGFESVQQLFNSV